VAANCASRTLGFPPHSAAIVNRIMHVSMLVFSLQGHYRLRVSQDHMALKLLAASETSVSASGMPKWLIC